MGSSKSKSSASTTYSNTDNRAVADNGASVLTTSGSHNTIAGAGGLSASGNNNVISVESVDKDIVGAALDTVKASDATHAEGFDKLLETAASLFDGAREAVQGAQDATLRAYTNAAADKGGTIDNRTIIVLGIAAAAAYAIGKAK